MKYLISGGGTGGHIFPAVSIANALRELDPQADILFVGALGRMEMERVPQAGYKIIGLPVRGFNRKQPWKNISVVWDLLRSMVQARRIVREFRPDVGIGVGGYASGAAMKVAAKMGVPILLQEQNGFAGVTNKLLKDDAQKICVAYEGMERFFPAEKILLTGNPVRQDLVHGSKEQAIAYLQKEYGVAFSLERPTLLIIGGSLGARTINQALLAGVQQLLDQGIQVIWQTGKTYYEQIRNQLSNCPGAQAVTGDAGVSPAVNTGKAGGTGDAVNPGGPIDKQNPLIPYKARMKYISDSSPSTIEDIILYTPAGVPNYKDRFKPRLRVKRNGDSTELFAPLTPDRSKSYGKFVVEKDNITYYLLKPPIYT